VAGQWQRLLHILIKLYVPN